MKQLTLRARGYDVYFNGTFPTGEIGRIFAAIDVFVVLSIWHENTLFIIYMAQTSMVSGDCIRSREVLGVVHYGKYGLLFPAGNALALAHLIDSLSHDPNMLK